MADFNEAIISIHPAFAEAIMCGRKTVELRRRIPNMAVGDRLWIYSTRPTASIVGTAFIDSILKGTPRAVWDAYNERIAISRLDFDRYFQGASEAIGIRLSHVQRIRPIGIEQLRNWKKGFHPPQVLARLTASEAKGLLQLGSFDKSAAFNVVPFLRA